ncbi:hypothetical protein HJFPF1_10836 [Paramyrothecium foliicola]|nr:hypothetical protein HJFPF1_10836 [Paramyrothecium foliicola]
MLPVGESALTRIEPVASSVVNAIRARDIVSRTFRVFLLLPVEVSTSVARTIAKLMGKTTLNPFERPERAAPIHKFFSYSQDFLDPGSKGGVVLELLKHDARGLIDWWAYVLEDPPKDKIR